MLQLNIIKENGDLISLGKGTKYFDSFINKANYTKVYLLAKNLYHIKDEPSKDLKFVFIDDSTYKQKSEVYVYESKEKYLEQYVEVLKDENKSLKNQIVNLQNEINSMQ